jgi:hypothetical protein
VNRPQRVATPVRDIPGWTGRARLYRLDPPLADYDGRTWEYVIVSATDVPFSGPETYIFPSDGPDAKVQPADWGEMPGSFKGALDHAAALRLAGYEVPA